MLSNSATAVAMPPGYRDRAIDLVNRPGLRVRVLTPLDFVIAKLRRSTDLDLNDVALAASPQDTALFLFRKTVELFCLDLSEASCTRSSRLSTYWNSFPGTVMRGFTCLLGKSRWIDHLFVHGQA